MDTFVHSSFGTVVMTLFQGRFSTPSWHTFRYLACGWAFASDRRSITTYMWLTGNGRQALFTLLCLPRVPAYPTLAPLGGGHPPGSPVGPRGRGHSGQLADTTKKKAGRHIEGLAATVMALAPHDKNTGRSGHEFRFGIMHVPLQRWPGHSLSVPIGLELYLKRPKPPPSGAVSLSQSVAPHSPRLRRRAGARAPHPEPSGRWLGHQGVCPAIAGGGPCRRTFPHQRPARRVAPPPPSVAVPHAKKAT